MYFSMNHLLVILVVLFFPNFICGTPNGTRNGFTARLIHRSSPLSPFYNPRKTLNDMVDEDHKIYELRARVIRNTTLDASLLYLPVSLQYILEFEIGTPGFKTFAIVDSGSSFNWLQCDTCTRCFDQNYARFDPRRSSTYKIIRCKDPVCDPSNNRYLSCLNSKCTFGFGFAIGPQIMGEGARETFTFEGDLTPKMYPDIVFGCVTEYYGEKTLEGMGGIIGIGHSEPSFLRQIKATQFSFCQSEDKFHDSFIKFGDDSDIWGEKTNLILSGNGHYQLILRGIDVNIAPVNISSSVFGSVYLDTEAAYTYLPAKAMDALFATIKLYVDAEYYSTKRWGLCYRKRGGSYVDMLPEITFNFLYLPMRLPFRSTWILNGEDYCLAIKESKFGFSVFGMYQMRGFNIGVDLLNLQVSVSHEDTCYEFGRRR